MTDPYLILHKVRGEPAFDIAIQMEVEDEVWWIIPTSGHRAYPYWQCELKAFYLQDESEMFNMIRYIPPTYPIPDDLPDHYPINHAELTVKPEARHRTILQRLGLAKPRQELKRI